MNQKHLSYIGTVLTLFGALVSCIGVYANNIMLDHILAMQIWRVSNFILLVWSVGLWRKWWDGGIAGIPLIAMYAWYCCTNEWGLWQV